MSRVTHRSAFAVTGVFVVAMALLSSFYGMWPGVRIEPPQFDLIIAVEAPQRLGCFAVYINADRESPVRACLTHDGPSNLVLKNVPARISIIRLDTGNEPNVEFILRRVTFATSEGYAPAPGRTLREFNATDIAAWVPMEAMIDAGTGLARTTGHNPQFHAKLDLDLAATLGPRPQGLALLAYLSKPLLATLGVEVLALILLGISIAKTYRGATATEQDGVWLALLCVLGFVMTIVSAYPGHSNYDEVYSLSEYWSGILSDLHPPLQTIVWATLIDIGRWVGLGPLPRASLLLATQAALFWLAAGVLAGLMQSKWLARAFLAILAFSPITLVYLGHTGKDSQFAIALFVAIACLALAAKRRSPLMLGLTIIPLFYAFAVRSNGPAAVLPLCFFWAAAAHRIFGWNSRSGRQRLAVSALAVGLFACLLGATRGLSRTVIQIHCCYGEQAFMPLVYDLMGVSVRLNKNVVPPAFHGDPNYDIEMIKKHFDQFSLDFDGLKRVTPDLYATAVISWLQALRDYPKELILHRLVLIGNCLGLHKGPAPMPYFQRFYVSMSSIPMPEGVGAIVKAYESIGHPFLDVRDFFEVYFHRTRDWPVYRLWIYIIVLGAAFAFPASRASAASALPTWLTASAACYLLPYILIANSAHFRYFWWPALAMFAAFILRADAIQLHLRSKREALPTPSAAGV